MEREYKEDYLKLTQRKYLMNSKKVRQNSNKIKVQSRSKLDVELWENTSWVGLLLSKVKMDKTGLNKRMLLTDVELIDFISPLTMRDLQGKIAGEKC